MIIKGQSWTKFIVYTMTRNKGWLSMDWTKEDERHLMRESSRFYTEDHVLSSNEYQLNDLSSLKKWFSLNPSIRYRGNHLNFILKIVSQALWVIKHEIWKEMGMIKRENCGIDKVNLAKKMKRVEIEG